MKLGGNLLRVTMIALVALLHQNASANDSVQPDWIADSTTGCKVWNPAPSPGESVSWSGQCKNGFSNGSGSESWMKNGVNGNIIYGDAFDGHLQGIVKVIYPDGSIYKGDLQPNGLRGGDGTLTYSNGDRYEGHFRDGIRDGQGKLMKSNGSRYVGQFARGHAEGDGILVLHDGARYVGRFKSGHPDGQGKMYWPNGTTYIGEWVAGKRSGYGKFRSNNGDSYEGYWYNNEMSGHGIYKWADGDRYEGEFLDSMPTEQGVFKKHTDHTCGILSGLAAFGAFGTSDNLGSAISNGLQTGADMASRCDGN